MYIQETEISNFEGLIIYDDEEEDRIQFPLYMNLTPFTNSRGIHPLHTISGSKQEEEKKKKTMRARCLYASFRQQLRYAPLRFTFDVHAELRHERADDEFHDGVHDVSICDGVFKRAEHVGGEGVDHVFVLLAVRLACGERPVRRIDHVSTVKEAGQRPGHTVQESDGGGALEGVATLRRRCIVIGAPGTCRGGRMRLKGVYGWSR